MHVLAMNDRPRLLALEEVKKAPACAMLYLEYKFPMKYHSNGYRLAETIRRTACAQYLAAHYGQWFRVWTEKPGAADRKANEWREPDGSEKESAV